MLSNLSRIWEGVRQKHKQTQQGMKINLDNSKRVNKILGLARKGNQIPEHIIVQVLPLSDP